MSDERPVQELLEVQAYFGLPSPALVEKDFQVVKALAAIFSLGSAAELGLVFGGGTALSRAYRLIKRMSEDIDLKVTAENPSRGRLRQLREDMTEGLLKAGFKFDPANSAQRRSANNNRYTVFQLPYEALAQGQGSLRPEIQIEVSVWPLRRPPAQLSMASFVAEAHGRPAEVARMDCVSIAQTAAEKFVALTRRTAAEIAEAGGPRDQTLVRHVHDLHVIRGYFDVKEITALAIDIARQDAEAFENQFPAYRTDPVAPHPSRDRGPSKQPAIRTALRRFPAQNGLRRRAGLCGRHGDRSGHCRRLQMTNNLARYLEACLGIARGVEAACRDKALYRSHRI